MAITTNTYVIKDTGFYSTDESGSASSVLAYSGAEILLPVKSMVFGFVSNLDSMSTGGYTADSSDQLGVTESDLVSVSNPIITLNCYYDINDSTQLTYLKALEKARRTHGYKEFYYKNDNDADYADRDKNLIDVFGHTDTQESNYTHLHVLLKQMQTPQTAKKDPNKIHFQLTLEVIP